MQAFGNSKTATNDNSSRFGKFVELSFDEDRAVHGAHLSHYLLEKSRVVHQGKGERNFHALYYMLGGAENETILPGKVKYWPFQRMRLYLRCEWPVVGSRRQDN